MLGECRSARIARARSAQSLQGRAGRRGIVLAPSAADAAPRRTAIIVAAITADHTTMSLPNAGASKRGPQISRDIKASPAQAALPAAREAFTPGLLPRTGGRVMRR